VVTYEGSSFDALLKAFKESVDDYLEFCAKRGETPADPIDTD
jgi:predicted HicB family RNase H-like nuclease